MSLYSDAIAKQRQEMNQVESESNRRMLRAYDDMIRSLDDDLQAITHLIESARIDGDNVNPDWLRRQSRYTHLMNQLASSRVQFERTGSSIITDTHGTSIENGWLHAFERERILFRNEPAVTAGMFDANINFPAMENLIGQTGSSSPLSGVLKSHGDGAEEIITRELLSGLKGSGADQIYRSIRNQLLSPVAESRLMALVRTEMMTAYRASTHEQYRQAPEIDGWMWSAHHGPRTCLACLAMSGEVFPMDQPFTQAHVCCRCSASPWPKDMYPSVRAHLQKQGSGEDWIRRQDPDVQRKLFPSADAFEAFKRGDLRLKDFVGYTDSPVWGRKIYQVSGRQAMAKAGVVPPPKPQPKPTFKTFKDDGEINAWTAPFATPWAKGLTKPQFNGLDNYRSNGYRTINRHLRFGDPIHKYDKKDIAPISRAISKSQIPENVVTYRGVGEGFINPTTQVGEYLQDSGFMSVSLSERKANEFIGMAKNNQSSRGEVYLVRIHLPAGTNAAYMDAMNGMGGVTYHEKELLLGRGSVIEITNIEKRDDGVTIVDADLVP